MQRLSVLPHIRKGVRSYTSEHLVLVQSHGHVADHGVDVEHGDVQLVADAGGVGRQIRTLQYHGADVGVLLQTLADHTHHLVGDSLQVELLVGMGVDTAPLRLVVEAQNHQMVAVRDLGPLQMLLPQMVLVGGQYRHLAVGSHHRLHKGDLQQRAGEHQLRHRGGQPLLIIGGKAAAGGDGLDTLLRQILAHGNELVQRCADHPNIVGVKDSSTGNMESILFAVKDKPDFTVMSGSVNNFFTAMTMGGAGGVLSLANSFPEITVELYGLLVNKQYADAIALNTHLLEINRAIGGAGGVAAVKAAMDMNGLAGGDPRLPLLPLTAEQKEALKAKLKGFGLLN